VGEFVLCEGLRELSERSKKEKTAEKVGVIATCKVIHSPSKTDKSRKSLKSKFCRVPVENLRQNLSVKIKDMDTLSFRLVPKTNWLLNLSFLWGNSTSIPLTSLWGNTDGHWIWDSCIAKRKCRPVWNLSFPSKKLFRSQYALVVRTRTYLQNY